MSDYTQEPDEKLVDILKSIKKSMDKPSLNFEKDEKNSDIKAKKQDNDDVFELTDIFNSDRLKHDTLISNSAQDKSILPIKELSEAIKNQTGLINQALQDPLNNMVLSVMKPLIKEWLDNNLPNLVEKIVADEIKRLILKANK